MTGGDRFYAEGEIVDVLSRCGQCEQGNRWVRATVAEHRLYGVVSVLLKERPCRHYQDWAITRPLIHEVRPVSAVDLLGELV